MKTNIISMHSTVTPGANLATMAAVARQTGFDAIEPVYKMLEDFFAAGMTTDDFRRVTEGLELPAVGWIADIECQGDRFQALMNHAKALFALCEKTGTKGVEILTGPLDWQAVAAYRSGTKFEGYMGLQGQPLEAQKEKTAENLKQLVDAAARHGVTLYMETLAWTPLAGLDNARELIDRAGRDNVKICMDFWHAYIAGDTPEKVSALPKKYLYGVHVCDSKPYHGGIPTEEELRTVPLGEGVIPVKDYVVAVKATGYDLWWAGEAMDRKLNQMDYREAARINYEGIRQYL